MPRLNLLVKGNVDVHDALHSCRIGGELVWNGINAALKQRYPDVTIRIKHETWTRSDALLAASGTIPSVLQDRNLPLGMYSAESQFSTALFETSADAIIMSVQPDVATSLLRHKASGFFLYPYGFETWAPADKAWANADFERAPPMDTAAIIRNFVEIIARIRLHTEAPVLIFNMSPIVPGEWIHCFQGFGETFSTRVRRTNLALIEVSEQTGASIIDVDAILASDGALAHKLDALHLNPSGYRLVAEEVVRVLADLGVITAKTEALCAPV